MVVNLVCPSRSIKQPIVIFMCFFSAFSFACKFNLGFHGFLKRIPFWPPVGKQCPWNCIFRFKYNWLCQFHLQKLLTKIWSTFDLLLFSKRDYCSVVQASLAAPWYCSLGSVRAVWCLLHVTVWGPVPAGTSPTMPHPTFHHQLGLVKWIPFSFYVARFALRHHTHNAHPPN